MALRPLAQPPLHYADATGVSNARVFNDLVQGYIYYFGIWEPNLTAWLSDRFREMDDTIFLDVGANVGYYSLLAHGGNVVAIEASPMIFHMLEENVRLNGY